MSETPQVMTREELDALVLKYREVKHSVNNHIAVLMALAELSQQNPQHVEKLIKAALERSPQIVSLMQNFQRELGAKLKDQATGAR
jgi:two-component sensor histidine kinase